MSARNLMFTGFLGIFGAVLACEKVGGPRCEPALGAFGLTLDCEMKTVFSDCKLESSGYGAAGTVEIGVKVVASGLKVPWGIAWLEAGDMLVTERAGDLRRVKADGTVLPNPVAKIPIATAGEGGLLGLALHPQFASNRWVYLYYTADGLAGLNVNRVERWVLSQDGLTATADKMIIDKIPALQFHNGGRIRFGPDGHLYVATGDAGNPPLAQDPFSTAGKILRLADDGSVPGDNPFPGSATWISGIRNGQGFDWLPDGRMVLTDHGPTGLPQEGGREGHDEISVGKKGSNMGWPTIYGCEGFPGLVAPRMAWRDPMPPGGTAIYTGTEIPAWRGDVLIGVLGLDEDVPHLHRIRLEKTAGKDAANLDIGTLAADNLKVTISETYLRGALGHGRLREVVMGPDGGLYVTTSECDGRGSCEGGDKILRIGRKPDPGVGLRHRAQ